VDKGCCLFLLSFYFCHPVTAFCRHVSGKPASHLEAIGWNLYWEVGYSDVGFSNCSRKSGINCALDRVYFPLCLFQLIINHHICPCNTSLSHFITNYSLRYNIVALFFKVQAKWPPVFGSPHFLLQNSPGWVHKKFWYGTLFTADDLGILGLGGAIILERLLK